MIRPSSDITQAAASALADMRIASTALNDFATEASIKKASAAIARALHTLMEVQGKVRKMERTS